MRVAVFKMGRGGWSFSKRVDRVQVWLRYSKNIRPHRGCFIIMSKTESKAVLEVCRLRKAGHAKLVCVSNGYHGAHRCNAVAKKNHLLCDTHFKGGAINNDLLESLMEDFSRQLEALNIDIPNNVYATNDDRCSSEEEQEEEQEEERKPKKVTPKNKATPKKKKTTTTKAPTCKGHNKKTGDRCKRATLDKSGFCHLHQ